MREERQVGWKIEVFLDELTATSNALVAPLHFHMVNVYACPPDDQNYSSLAHAPEILIKRSTEFCRGRWRETKTLSVPESILRL
jgi:hypothetical protein